MSAYKEKFDQEHDGVKWDFQNDDLEKKYKDFAEKVKKSGKDEEYQKEKAVFESEREKWYALNPKAE